MINCIDVSNWQVARVAGILLTEPNWSRVAASTLSPKIVYIKLGEGWSTGYRLDDALRMYDKAGEAGIPYRSWYHYAHPEYSAAQQAVYTKLRAGTRLGELPVVVDLEDCDGGWYKPHPVYNQAQFEGAKADAYRLRIWMIDYLHAMDDVFGRLTSIYTGGWWIDWLIDVCAAYGYDTTAITKRPLYNASYTNAEQVAHGWKQSTVWQYTSSLSIDGISGRTDGNVYHGDAASLAAWAAGAVPPEPAPTPAPTTTPYKVVNATGTYIMPAPSWAGVGRWVGCGAIVRVIAMGEIWLQCVGGYVQANRVAKV